MSGNGLATVLLFGGGGLLIGLILLLETVGGWADRQRRASTPRAMTRRAVELECQAAERRIAELGDETRAAIRALAERRRAAGSVRDQPDR